MHSGGSRNSGRGVVNHARFVNSTLTSPRMEPRQAVVQSARRIHEVAPASARTCVLPRTPLATLHLRENSLGNDLR